MGERIRFVIVSCPRTGSTHLVDYLAAVPGVRCLSEIFRPGEILLRHSRSLDPKLLDVAARDADPLGWLEQLDVAYGDADWFGFKLFPGQQSALLRLLCADPSWRKIYLWRDNFLDQYISFLLAMRHFGSKEWGRVPGDQRFAIMPDTMIPDLAAIERNYLAIEQALLTARREDLFGLEYEDLGRTETMRHLLQFLTIPGDVIDAVTAEAADRPVEPFERGPNAGERIQNYEDVRRVLECTRYRRFLPE